MGQCLRKQRGLLKNMTDRIGKILAGRDWRSGVSHVR
jgi:hypothetical protein